MTARDFVVPADQVVHGAARLARCAARAAGTHRSGGTPRVAPDGGRGDDPDPDDYDPLAADFQRYGVSIARARVINPRVVARVRQRGWRASDLDRFSRYSFGTFDNRLRGYPSALIRYDRGAVVRTALAWGASRFVRMDGFVDSAAVHDPGFGTRIAQLHGVGAALEAPAPFGTLVAVEWGYGFRGVNSDGTLGTQVVRVSGYKVF